MAMMANNELLQTGSTIVSVTLFCFFSLIMLHDFRQERAKIEKEERQFSFNRAIESVVTHELDAALLTDEEEEIKFSNSAVVDRFSSVEDVLLTSAFDTILASPETLMFRFQMRATSFGAARDEIRTRDGVFRLSVVQFGENALL